MWHFPEAGARVRRADGFTLVEVMVAMGIFLVVTAAIVPLVIGGLRGAATARDITQSKGVGQARLEQIRDMPFYVGRAAGDYIDALDTYYRNMVTPTGTPSCASTTLTALPPTNWTGYVPSTGAHCVWEPAGPLYRTVVNPVVSPGLGVFSMVISAQFLSAGTPPTAVAPPTGYTSQTAGKDAPPSSQIGVTVAVFYKAQSGVRYTATFTQVERATPMDPLIATEAKSSTLRVSSALDDDSNLLEQLGVINLSGELFSGSRVVTTASAATAGSSAGQQITGASLNLVAPTDQAAMSASAGNLAFPTSGCDYQCFGNTNVDQASATSSSGLPRAGSPTAPVRARIPDGANNDGFRFSNGHSGNRLLLDNSKPMVSLDTSPNGAMSAVSGCVVPPTGSSNASYLTGTGYLDATATTVASCGTAQTNTIRMFPTTFAPNGVVKIVLDSATAYCSVSKASGPSVSAGYRATVSYYNGSGYTAVAPLSQMNTTDPLAAVDLTQSVGSPGLTLGDYISSWKSLVNADIKTSTTPKSATASVPGAISIITQPTREDTAVVTTPATPHQADPVSAISLTAGAVSCKASDVR